MKVLIDIKSMSSATWIIMNKFIKNFVCKEDELAVFIDKRNPVSQRETDILNLYQLDYVTANDDISGFDIYISNSSACPAPIQKETHIISIAIITDLIFRLQTIKSCAENMDNMRYWCGFDLIFSWFDVLPEYLSELEIDSDRHILADDSISMNAVTAETEQNEVSKRCTKNNFCHLRKRIEILRARMDIKPLVTIVTVTKDLKLNKREDEIAKCIESVENQSYCNIEYLIIDGDSKDGTVELLQKHIESFSNVRLISEPDSGLYDAMNKGIERANGEYILFLNSDDSFYDCDAVQYSMWQILKREARYSFGNALAIAENGQLTEWIGNIDLLPYAMNYCHQSMMVETNLLREYGGFNLAYRVSADSDIMIRLFANGVRYCFVNRMLVNYSAEGLSKQKREIACRDHSDTFYKNIGKFIGLTRAECSEIWAKNFLKIYSLEHIAHVLKKISCNFSIEPILANIIEEEKNKYPISLKQEIKKKLKNTLKSHLQITTKTSK